jgi:mannose-6-phosphate isomerase-like protein (cupin superfamily)
MKILNANTCVLKDSPSGEKFQVAIGRHEQHGSTKNHTIVIVEITPGLSSDPHFHKEREESYYFISGSGIAIVGDQEHSITPGTLIYASPLEKHQFVNNGADPLRYLVITAPCWIPQDSWK